VRYFFVNFVAAALGLALTATAASAVTLDGVWIGSGYAQPQSGERERLRCRVTYSRTARKVYSVVAICATAATRIRQTGELIMVRPGLYVGDFINHQYDIAGRVRVRTRGSHQSVTFSSQAGRGSLSLRKR
jgi:hypothetical protein